MKDFFGIPSEKEATIVVIILPLLFLCGVITAALTAPSWLF